MAALPQPQEHSQHSHHAAPGHVHRWRMVREYIIEQRCVECNVPKTVADSTRMAYLERRVEEMQAAFLEIHRMPPRVNGARYGGLASAKLIASTQIALSQWHDHDDDEQTN